MSTIRTFVHPSGLTQRVAVADLLDGQGETFRSLVQHPGALVYSDPPWNPGNEKWWRRHACASVPQRYTDLLDAWCRAVVACSPLHVFCEQSINDAHRQQLLDATARCPHWTLPLRKQWMVQYGSPLRPNVLLHFGHVRIATDPSGLHGEAMTRRVFEGLDLAPGGTVADPCMGLGMTSRVAHRFGQHCIGTELNPARLERTIAWLLRHGYTEQP